MLHSITTLDKRDKAILMGLFLSRFDKQALDSFGFSGFRQAYNVLGLSIGYIPKSIQNYRDEFDPYFPNNRKGWRNRELRDYCKKYMDITKDLSFDEFYALIKSFVDDDIVNENDVVKERKKTNRGFLANRLITGKAAEEYFMMNYQTIDVFHNYNLINTTQMGCGFDFKLSLNQQRYYVEVKGINDKTGNILMTEKEFSVASDLRDLYCLFIVSNFRERPEHKMFFDPLNISQLQFTRQEQIVTRISYSGKII
jgi:hypothetical protein